MTRHAVWHTLRGGPLTLAVLLFMTMACGGGSALGPRSDAAMASDGSLLSDAGPASDAAPQGDAQVTGCNPTTDPCCDPDGTPCDHGCDGTTCYPECDPAADLCCDPDGTACDHGCDGAVCYPECDPAAHPCCNADGTLSGGLHDVCEVGTALDPACDTCAAQVCPVDPYCCNGEWDGLCLDLVLTECGVDCGLTAPNCDGQYSTAPGYISCAENPGTCEFNTSTTGGSCAALCEGLGGECYDAYNDDATGCGWADHTGCGHTGFQTEICICSRGCGGQAPCPPPAVCQMGQCL